MVADSWERGYIPTVHQALVVSSMPFRIPYAAKHVRSAPGVGDNVWPVATWVGDRDREREGEREKYTAAMLSPVSSIPHLSL